MGSPPFIPVFVVGMEDNGGAAGGAAEEVVEANEEARDVDAVGADAADEAVGEKLSWDDADKAFFENIGTASATQILAQFRLFKRGHQVHINTPVFKYVYTGYINLLKPYTHGLPRVFDFV